MKFIAYFSKEVFGYKEFEAKDEEEADAKMEKFNYEGDFENDLDQIKDNGWIMVDMNKS